MDIVWKTPVEIVLFKASKRTNSSGVQVFQVFVSICVFQLAFLFSRSLVSSVAKALCGIIHPSGVNFRLEGIKGRLRRRESLAGIQISLGWNAFHIEHLIQKIENVCWLERDKPFLDINSKNIHKVLIVLWKFNDLKLWTCNICARYVRIWRFCEAVHFMTEVRI